MDFKHKLNTVKDIFKGKDPNIHPIHYMPVKTIQWLATTPDLYFDDDKDNPKSYTPEELVELGKKFFLVFISIVNSKEEIAISELADKRLEDIEAGISEPA